MCVSELVFVSCRKKCGINSLNALVLLRREDKPESDNTAFTESKESMLYETVDVRY